MHGAAATPLVLINQIHPDSGPVRGAGDESPRHRKYAAKGALPVTVFQVATPTAPLRLGARRSRRRIRATLRPARPSLPRAAANHCGAAAGATAAEQAKARRRPASGSPPATNARNPLRRHSGARDNKPRLARTRARAPEQPTAAVQDPTPRTITRAAEGPPAAASTVRQRTLCRSDQGRRLAVVREQRDRHDDGDCAAQGDVRQPQERAAGPASTLPPCSVSTSSRTRSWYRRRPS